MVSAAESVKDKQPVAERMVDIYQLADFLGIHEQTVRKMFKNKKLPEPMLIGNKKKWFESELKKHFGIDGSILPE